ncbi:diphosphomevalonate decarboxylase-like [Planococcus citri]|uniref:diphosphomevalonate decarboxylase-like n=1 Tax=Planococcus citri TaxID=170843 RepID=UPI0031FA368A
MDIKCVTGVAPVNIALIKYWGKRDEELILPLNDSLSVTLSTEYMHSKTSIAISPNFTEDEIWINGRKETMDSFRLRNCIAAIKNLAKEKIPSEELNWKIRICTENNFPTAAGLASSASGFACLVFVLSKLYGVDAELSRIARLGSGSACRSLYGGFVQWHAGSLDDGSDSLAKQVFPVQHWPNLHCLILVVNAAKKKTSSTIGMRRAVVTSRLLPHRLDYVPQNIEKLTQAIKSKDFDSFAEITIRDSNQFHAICLDTYPPETYMNDVSHCIASFVHQYNAAFGHAKVTYTFDAGPNACLFLLEENVPLVLKTILKIFPNNTTEEGYLRGIPVDVNKIDVKNIPEINLDIPANALKFLIHTKIGDGPVILNDPGESLISSNGELLNIISEQ